MKNLTKKQIIILSVLGVLLLGLIVYVILSLLYKYPSDTFIVPKALNPTFVSLGKLEVRWYAICVIGGASLLSLYGYHFFLKIVKLDSDTTLTGVTWGIIAGVLGARLYYVIFNPPVGCFDDGFFRGIINIINPANGGLAIHGGIYAAIIAIFIFCIVKHVKFIELVEIVMPVFMLAQVVGRWGNFFNQEAYGPLVKVAQDGLTQEQIWIKQHELLRHLLVPNFVVKNMYFTDWNPDSSFFGQTGYFHPTFFYEGVANFIGAVTYINLRRHLKKLYVGDGVCFYLTWYGLVRLFIELLRQDPLTFTLFGHTFKTAVVTSILFMVVGIGLFIARRIAKFHLVSAKAFLYEGGSLWKDGYTTGGKPIEDNESNEEVIEAESLTQDEHHEEQ